MDDWRLPRSAELGDCGGAATRCRPTLKKAISAGDRRMAEVAWRYFAAQTNAEIGFCNATRNFPSTTMWDLGSCLMAWVAAERFELVDRATVERTLSKIVASLQRMPLVATDLPNKVYNVKTLDMVNYGNKPAPGGIGWSALDIARLLIGLKVAADFAPALQPKIDSAIARWNLRHLVRAGQLYGGRKRPDGTFQAVQEGRIGYEQYAGLALLKLGLPTHAAARSSPNIRFRTVDGLNIPDDRRTVARFHAITMTTSDPYLLAGFEIGLNDELERQARAILAVQQARFERTGVLTAVGEAHIDRPPYFVYNAVLANGRPWGVINPVGKPFDELRFFTTHAAIGWFMLKPGEHTRKLISATAGLDSPNGWYAGRFERDQSQNKALSANVNGSILEALHFRYYGPFLTF